VFLVSNESETVRIVESDGCKATTNNRMELQAVIEALKTLKAWGKDQHKVTLHSDSKYVVDGANVWFPNWEKDGRLARGQVFNADLWQQLMTLVREFPNLYWVWVRGHNGDEMNEMVDKLAQAAARKMLT
jgi:ribonuclease HI